MNIPSGPILVVEDNPNVRELIESTLRFKGYPVITAGDGEEALRTIASQPPSLVISDILMPHMDGYHLAYLLSKDPRTRRIPFIFVSATFLSPADKAFALGLGAVRFVEKPIDTEDFLLTVAEVLTQGISSFPEPMGDRAFYTGYRERLDQKLNYKNVQIARIERLLETLPEPHRPAFEQMRAEAETDRAQILEELSQLKTILKELEN